MYFPSIDDYLRRETTSEIWHKEHPGKISKLYYDTRYYKEIEKGIFYTNYKPELMINDINISKESRYTHLYPSFHDFYEITFIYSGKSTYYINNKAIELNEGDVILIQKGVIRSTDYSDKDDVIMNIIFKEELVNLNFLSEFPNNRFIYRFYAKDFFSKSNDDGYVVIKNSHNRLLDLSLECLCTLYYSERKFNYTQLMHDYFRILFQQLITTINDNKENKDDDYDYVIYQILNYIANNYQNGSLKNISDTLGYNYNYLSNLIKKQFGKSFSEIKLEYQLNNAYHLLKNGNLPIYEICQECGFLNRNYFYKKFESYYGVTPSEFRKNNRIDL